MGPVVKNSVVRFYHPGVFNTHEEGSSTFKTHVPNYGFNNYTRSLSECNKKNQNYKP